MDSNSLEVVRLEKEIAPGDVVAARARVSKLEKNWLLVPMQSRLQSDRTKTRVL